MSKVNDVDPNQTNERPVRSDGGDRANSRPALLNIKSMPVNTALNFSTDVLDPVVFNQNFCRFQLSRKGFLHPNSQITIQVSNNSGGHRAFPFTNVGLFALIDRAVLKTQDGRVLCSTEDLNRLQACKSTFISNSANKEREQYKTGRQNAYQTVYDDRLVNGADIGLSNNKDYHSTNGLVVENHLLNDRESIFSLSLHELFPYLKSGNQLPLYMMPTVQIEIYFNNTFWTAANQDARYCVPGNSGQEFLINQANTQLYADYLFYSGDFMEEYRNRNNNLTFAYTDYRLAKNTLTAAQAASAVRNVGGNGNIVTKLFYGLEPVTVATADQNLLGPYLAQGTDNNALADNVQVTDFSTNVFYNSEFLRPQNTTNAASHFHNLISAEGAPCFLSRGAYSGASDNFNAGAEGEFEGLAQQAQLGGWGFFQGERLNKGQRVDTKGIDLHLNGTFTAAGGLTLRCWLEVMRFATLKDGVLEVYYA